MVDEDRYNALLRDWRRLRDENNAYREDRRQWLNFRNRVLQLCFVVAVVWAVGSVIWPA